MYFDSPARNRVPDEARVDGMLFSVGILEMSQVCDF